MDIRKLSPVHAATIKALLLEAPYEAIALRGLINYGNLAILPWYGSFHDEELVGVGMVIPNQLGLVWSRPGISCSEIGHALATHSQPCTTIGPPECAETLWQGWTTKPYSTTHQTTLLATKVPTTQIHDGFRLATAEDIALVARYSGAGEEEETGKNTFKEQPERLEKIVANRIQMGHTWVIENEGDIVFQVHVAPVLADCCQLVGTYVPPQHRGSGWSTIGVRGLLQAMIPQTKAVVLRVDNENIPAIKCYKANGFRPIAPFSVLNSHH